MLLVTLFCILAAVALYLVRALLGPTVFDRILALNALGTKTVLLVAVIGILSGRTDHLDIALLYALVNFIGTLAMLKLVHRRQQG
jgi:multicomponent Na+:H+ antiporter subunit F